MSELVLYGDTQTSRTWWNDWTFRELNLEYENVKFGFLDPEIRSDDFLALHPNGLIPTIKDGDFVLWDPWQLTCTWRRSPAVRSIPIRSKERPWPGNGASGV